MVDVVTISGWVGVHQAESGPGKEELLRDGGSAGSGRANAHVAGVQSVDMMTADGSVVLG